TGAMAAQVETARITGTVADPPADVVPAADVTNTHQQTNRRFATQTGADGRYEAPNLPLGDYEVVVEADGFKRTVRTGINLEVREAAVVDIALEVGQLTESVSVVADAPLLTTVEAAQGEVISNKQIVDFPLNGRSYIKLALLSTGAMMTDTGRRASFSASGMRPSQNNVMLDGIDNNNLQSATHSRRSDAASISIDAVQEFKVETNAFSAEYGKSAGGVVNVVMKSGTNEVHGTVYGFLRNEVFDAKNFFDDP
ncbi:MAG: TonB-dependent receptor, partial [bacterium]|nr:TonB-dependent receptor [bacterium]